MREGQKGENVYTTTETACGKNNALEIKIKRIMHMTDYYAILDLGRGASDEQIKKAFRKISLLIHPDRCKLKNSEAAFKKVLNAKEALLNRNAQPEPMLRPHAHFDADIFNHINRFHGNRGFYRYSYEYDNMNFANFMNSGLHGSPFYNVYDRSTERGNNVRYVASNSEAYKLLTMLFLFLIILLNWN